uniref:Uncharacterized protein n=1 Tax=Ignisphaera aggregans TaxID=334771 RepID=A0A7J2TC07_9CREN
MILIERCSLIATSVVAHEELIKIIYRRFLKNLEEQSIRELLYLFQGILKEAGYNTECQDNYCGIMTSSLKPIHMLFYPWPRSDIVISKLPGDKLVIIRGTPSESILRYLQQYLQNELWIFYNDRKSEIIIIVSDEYTHSRLKEILNVLANKFQAKTLSISLNKQVEEMSVQELFRKIFERLQTLNVADTQAAFLRLLGLCIQTREVDELFKLFNIAFSEEDKKLISAMLEMLRPAIDAFSNVFGSCLERLTSLSVDNVDVILGSLLVLLIAGATMFSELSKALPEVVVSRAKDIIRENVYILPLCRVYGITL